MKTGDVFTFITEWQKSTVRIIVMDDLAIMYDALWDDGSWTFLSNLNKTCHYYIISRLFFEEKTIFKESVPLTDLEFQCFRPDLPLRLCRQRDVSWDMSLDKIMKDKDEIVLKTNKIVLYPFGKGKSLKRSTTVISSNPKGFKENELIKFAHELQNNTSFARSKGIGLFRLGSEKGIPSYYIGSYIDDANIAKE